MKKMKKKLQIKLVVTFIVFCNIATMSYSQNWNTFNTSHGYIKLGPANASWAHIYTDAPKFIFNKDIYSSIGGFSSYSWYDMTLKTAGIPRMTIKRTNGNVGIGTSSPLEKLHVNGNSIFDGRLTVNHNVANDWGYGLHVKVNRDKTKALSIGRNYVNGDVFTVWGNGVVNAKKIWAEEIEIVVDPTGFYWPDYVFSDDYELLSLNEVDNYIRFNKHLPDVPSEDEILNEGLNLGEMDAVLLRKIEELTLYVIEQQKEIDDLKKIVNNSKNTISK